MQWTQGSEGREDVMMLALQMEEEATGQGFLGH